MPKTRKSTEALLNDLFGRCVKRGWSTPFLIKIPIGALTCEPEKFPDDMKINGVPADFWDRDEFRLFCDEGQVYVDAEDFIKDEDW